MEEKNTRTRKIITAGIIIGVIIFAIVLILIKPKCSTISSEVAECIANKSILYIQDGCHFCKIQVEKFGKCSKMLNIVDCTEDPIFCFNKGIKHTPTWFIDDKLIEGAYKIEELQNMTGCWNDTFK